MNAKNKRFTFVLIGLVLVKSTILMAQVRETDFNRNWKFSLKADNHASKAQFDDSTWRMLNLPHDWSVEFPFDSAHGEGCTGYLPGGIGWYRKHFSLQPHNQKQVFVLFDGVYNNSEYWINGHKLGERPYGYVPFYFDLTPYLNPTGDNVLAVRVDRSRTADSRWYPGSGIYRKVTLIQVDPVHIPIWGVRVTTPRVSAAQATVQLDITMENQTEARKDVTIVTEILNPQGDRVGAATSSQGSIPIGKNQLVQQVEMERPLLWNLDDPNLYQAVTRIVQDGRELDRVQTVFGIRTFRFDPDSGFYLNGRNMKIKGVCLHHSAGAVGAAVPEAVWRRRLEILKDMGCNAIRMAHNPGSEELLQLCDEMGFLVQDEFFDEWFYPKDKRLNCWEQHDDYLSRGYAEHFGEWAQSDLTNTVLAHRNHPSIIQWSIGNEIEWTYPSNRFATGFFDNMNWDGNYFWSPPPYSPEQIKAEYGRIAEKAHPVEEVAKTLAAWTRALDSTRPVIANCILPSASFQTGYADALDIVGFSYRRVMYDYAKKLYPDKIVMGTENLPQWHEWKAVAERPFVPGLFLWTGFDHMGEVHDSWPVKTSPVGLLDQIGFPNTGYHMFKSLWTDTPHIMIYTQLKDSMNYVSTPRGNQLNTTPEAWDELTWYSPIRNEHWNYEPGQEVLVEVLSNCEQVELFLNSTSLGLKKLADFPDRKYQWFLPYQAGNLTARGMKNGEAVYFSLTTAGEPVALKVETDRSFLHTNANDVAHVALQLLDAHGNPVSHTNRKIEFELQGAVKNLGVDNGNRSNTQYYKANSITTYRGRALMIIQAGEEVGTACVRVNSHGMSGQEIRIPLY